MSLHNGLSTRHIAPASSHGHRYGPTIHTSGRPVADGPVLRACSLLVFAVDRAGRGGRGRAGLRLARVAHLPDPSAGVVGDEERTVLGDGERGGPSPHLGALFTRRPEAGHEILVVARRLPVLEWHAHHLVAGRLGAVP